MRMLIAVTGDEQDSEYDKAVDYCRNEICFDQTAVDRIRAVEIEWLAQAIAIIAQGNIDGAVFMHKFNENASTKILFDVCSAAAIPVYFVPWSYEIKNG